MNVLLLSMPDSFEHMPPIAIRMPNGALASLAGNVDPHHRVSIADLILAQSSAGETLKGLVDALRPDVVGLSVMTFQRATAFRIARLIRSLSPNTRIVVGGYDPSLAPEAYAACEDVHFLVRGEGEQTFCELLRALDDGGSVEAIAGLSYRTPNGVVRNPERPIARLASAAPPQPRRPRTPGLHAARPPGGRHRDLERVHV
jgi:anaerobic magnesium-protoporphyrin IX monomethyl ester cyclase